MYVTNQTHCHNPSELHYKKMYITNQTHCHIPLELHYNECILLIKHIVTFLKNYITMNVYY